MDRSTAFSVLNRWLLGLAGVGALIAGTIALFKTQNGAGTAAMLTVGTLLFAIALVGKGIESLEFGGTKIKLLAVETAEQKLARADEKEESGDLGAAARLRGSAQAILDVAGVHQSSIYVGIPLDADETIILSKLANYNGSGGILELTNKRLMFRAMKFGSGPNLNLSLHDISSVRKGADASTFRAPQIIVTTKLGDQIKVGIVAYLTTPNRSKENNTHRDQMLEAISQAISQSPEG